MDRKVCAREISHAHDLFIGSRLGFFNPDWICLRNSGNPFFCRICFHPKESPHQPAWYQSTTSQLGEKVFRAVGLGFIPGINRAKWRGL
jgi:hypothetical protein